MGSFGISEGNIIRKKKKKKNNPQIIHLTDASREVAQMPVSGTSEWGLDREALAT